MSALKKATILASVTTSPLAKHRMLRDLGVPKSTYYRWLRLQQHHQGLEDRPGVSTPPWNRLRSQEERSILEAAREMPELSSRQLATWTTDNLGFAVSESTVYRILRREGLVKSPEMQLKASQEYHRKTTGPHQRGYVNRCVNDIRRRPSQPLIQWRFHPHTVHRDRRLRSTQGPSDA